MFMFYCGLGSFNQTFLFVLTLYILMDFLKHIDAKSIRLPIVYIKGSHIKYLRHDVFLSLRVVLFVANSADHDPSRGFLCMTRHNLIYSLL